MPGMLPPLGRIEREAALLRRFASTPADWVRVQRLDSLIRRRRRQEATGGGE